MANTNCDIKKEIRRFIEDLIEIDCNHLSVCMLDFYFQCTGYRLSPGYRLSRIWKDRLRVLFEDQPKELFASFLNVFILCTSANPEKRIDKLSVLKETIEFRNLKNLLF